MIALLPLLALVPQDSLPGPLQVKNLGVRLRDGTRAGSLTLDGPFLGVSEARRNTVSRKFTYDRRHGLRQLSASTLQNGEFSHLLGHGLFVTTGSESLLGDLNGDGDGTDVCVVGVDLAHDVTMPALTIGTPNDISFVLGADLIGMRIFESIEGVMLNGDFDTNDVVAVGWQPSTSSFLSPSYSIYRMYALDGAWTFEISEGGERHDYTHDGDRTDKVYGVQDLATGSVTILPLAIDSSNPIRTPGQRVFAFNASEADTGVDLDGDGLLTKSILHAYSLDRGELVNLQTESSVFDHLEDGHTVAFSREEAGLVDLNGDGDMLDSVAQVYDGLTGTITNTGLAAPNPAYRVVLDGTLLTFRVSESAQGGTDLNGDGDTSDTILHTLDLATGTVLNTGFPHSPNAEGILILNEKIVGDQNGDGDAVDQLPHFLGGGATPGFTLPLNTNLALGSGRWLYLLVAESNVGQDLNGDGDQLDLVYQLYDRTTGDLTNTGLEYDDVVLGLSGHFGLFRVPENGLVDLNGDGDTSDEVMHVRDLKTGATRNLGLAIHPSDFATMNDELWAFPVDEMRQGADLDGNGVIEDVRVLHVIDREHKLRAR